jgi:hypothetical protein
VVSVEADSSCEASVDLLYVLDTLTWSLSIFVRLGRTEGTRGKAPGGRTEGWSLGIDHLGFKMLLYL